MERSSDARLMIRKTTNISVDDTVVIYPSYGRLAEDGRSWRIEVCGTVYESGSISRHKQMLLRLMQRVAKVEPAAAERALFDERVRAFIAPTERGKRVVVRLADQTFRIRKKTQRNGRFVGRVRLSAEIIESLMADGAVSNGWVELSVLGPDGTDWQQGRVKLLGAEGISVISDIDDTLKVTEVHSRSSLIANTFLREFRAVDGMAARYQEWAAEGVDFHYVSSSPWQLFNPLCELFEQAGYPAGSFHLRSFRLREHMLRRLLLIRRHGKVKTIRSILRQFPQRSFVLIGDSGEKDPEIYGALARRYRSQVRAILIRQVPDCRLEHERLWNAFRGLPADRWSLFTDPAELPSRLTELPGR